MTVGTIRITVRGHVQGVGYRSFVLAEARQLGVTGFVRNLDDSHAVEVMSTGPEPILASFLGRLRAGPVGAGVKDTVVERLQQEIAFQDFRILY